MFLFFCLFCTSLKIKLLFSLVLIIILFYLSFFRNEVMFKNEFCDTTVWHISRSFRPGGMLSSGPAEVGIYLISEKYKGSNKLVIPFWITVSCLFSFRFCLFSFLFFLPTFIHVCFLLFSRLRFIVEILVLMCLSGLQKELEPSVLTGRIL